MIDIALTIGFASVFVSMAVCVWRIVRGPTAPDRILALDTLSINAIALLMLVGIYLRNDIFFEAGLLIAMMGFIGTVSLSKHIAGRSIIE
jgi:multicomponent K+:H+ antiporter subunit F